MARATRSRILEPHSKKDMCLAIPRWWQSRWWVSYRRWRGRQGYLHKQYDSRRRNGSSEKLLSQRSISRPINGTGDFNLRRRPVRQPAETQNEAKWRCPRRSITTALLRRQMRSTALVQIDMERGRDRAVARWGRSHKVARPSPRVQRSASCACRAADGAVRMHRGSWFGYAIPRAGFAASFVVQVSGGVALLKD
jgi:hypothetical protein